MPAATLLGWLKSVPLRKCFPFSSISSTRWGLDAPMEIKVEKRNTEKIPSWQHVSVTVPIPEQERGTRRRKLPCWGFISQAGLGPGSSLQESKGSSPVSFSSWQWALLSLGILSLCGSSHGTSAPPKPIGLPLFQLAVAECKAPLPPPPHIIGQGDQFWNLEWLEEGGLRSEFAIQVLSPLSAGACLSFVLMHILVLIGKELH